MHTIKENNGKKGNRTELTTTLFHGGFPACCRLYVGMVMLELLGNTPPVLRFISLL